MTARIRLASELARRRHRDALSLTGASRASTESVAKALDEAIIRWAESDGVVEPESVKFVAVPRAALDELREFFEEHPTYSNRVNRFLAAVDRANEATS